LIRADFLSLLAILSHNITKAALVLNPSSPSYTAAIAPLIEIAAKLTSISHCVRLLTPTHGKTFANEATSLARQVVDAVRSLAQTLNATIDHPDIARDDYLVRTATVHDLIDKARGPDGLSADNVSAVRKLWLNDQASLVDGYEELVQMIEDVPKEFDDGWDDLDLGTVPLSEIEIERAKKAKNLLQLSTLLHKRIATDILSSIYSSDSNPHLDLLPQHSSALLVASDDLVASMYGPQNTENMVTELTSFKTVIQNLQAPVTPLLLQDKSKKWFNTCFEQIFKAADALLGII
ncbi:hypothetical protein F5887DRAFT_857007, partial [Amanita rubescens]